MDPTHSTYFSPLPNNRPRYRAQAITDYDAQEPNELSLRAHEVSTGRWFIEMQGIHFKFSILNTK